MKTCHSALGYQSSLGRLLADSNPNKFSFNTEIEARADVFYIPVDSVYYKGYKIYFLQKCLFLCNLTYDKAVLRVC